MLSLSLSTIVQLIKYPIEHPLIAIACLLTLNNIRKISSFAYDTYFNEDNIKYPLDALHTAYRGPSVVYVSDTTFDPTKDLVGWVTDRHPSGYFDQSGPKTEWREVTTSFNLNELSNKDREGLQERHSAFYSKCASEIFFSGYGDLLSHRASCGDMQSTFGFYGQKNLDKLAKFHRLNAGFVIGIRAFGDHAYDAHVKDDNSTYRLVKINLDKIDRTQVNFEYNSEPGIAHVYVKNGEVCTHPMIEKEKKDFVYNWTTDSTERYIKHLPNFVSTVDWVIAATDVPKVMQGEEVENLLNHGKINIVEWQTAQEKIGHSPLRNQGMFALSRPRDYQKSFHFNEAGREEIKPPLLFKI